MRLCGRNFQCELVHAQDATCKENESHRWTTRRQGRLHQWHRTRPGAIARPHVGSRGCRHHWVRPVQQTDVHPYPDSTPEDLAESRNLIEETGRTAPSSASLPSLTVSWKRLAGGPESTLASSVYRSSPRPTNSTGGQRDDQLHPEREAARNGQAAQPLHRLLWLARLRRRPRRLLRTARPKFPLLC
jgi:hypothetical protein